MLKFLDPSSSAALADAADEVDFEVEIQPEHHTATAWHYLH